MDELNLQREYQALKAGAGMRLLQERLIVRLSGDDCVAFMHGMCSADIKGLAPGSLAPALFLTEHAHLLADCFVYALEDGSLLIDLDRTLWTGVRAHLEKFLVADDVEIEELDTLAVLDIEGPRAAEALCASGLGAAATLAPWHHVQAGPIRIANLARFGAAALSVIASHAAAARLAAGLASAQATVRVCALDAETLEIERIENGIARAGLDTTDKTLALEARMDWAISYNKGCYIGQETVERTTARGGLKKRLYGLKFTGARIPARGASIMLDGKEAGRLGSVARSPAAGIIGLAILHHSAWPEGTAVEAVDASGGVFARVTELPFKLNS